MYRMTKRFLCIFLVVFFLNGCASRKEIVQFKRDMVYLRIQTNVLQNDYQEIKKELTAINKSLAELKVENRRARADLLSELSNLLNQTQFLDSKLEDTSYRMSKLMSQVEGSPARHSAVDSSSGASDSQFSAPEDAGADINFGELFNAAYLDLSSGNYQLALQGFQEYLNKSPAGEFADDARYCIGEISYARGDYKAASDEFKKVILDYPRSDKMASALLKMGYCAIQLGDLNGARKYFNSVIQIFPKSEEAALAKARLEELK